MNSFLRNRINNHFHFSVWPDQTEKFNSYKMKKVSILLAVLLVFNWGCIQNSGKGLDKRQVAQENSLMTDPLPSWNDLSAKKVIIDFVAKTTEEGSADFIPVADRIACFDNDGCLWTEKPFYFQLFFAIDRVKSMAPQHPEWKITQPFKDRKSVV